MTEDIKSAFNCQVCGRPAIYYGYKGRYKESFRCLKHKPSTIKIKDEVDYGCVNKRQWVACGKGLTMVMQSEVDETYEKMRKVKS